LIFPDKNALEMAALAAFFAFYLELLFLELLTIFLGRAQCRII